MKEKKITITKFVQSVPSDCETVLTDKYFFSLYLHNLLARIAIRSLDLPFSFRQFEIRSLDLHNDIERTSCKFACLYVSLWFYVPFEKFFTHMETSRLLVKSSNFDLNSALMAIDQ